METEDIDMKTCGKTYSRYVVRLYLLYKTSGVPLPRKTWPPQFASLRHRPPLPPATSASDSDVDITIHTDGYQHRNALSRPVQKSPWENGVARMVSNTVPAS